MTSAPSASIMQLRNKKGKTIYTERDINLSFALLMSPLIPQHPLIPGESHLFCELPEGLGCSWGGQLVDISAFGSVRARGLGGRVRGYHLYVSTKWSVLLPLLFW